MTGQDLVIANSTDILPRAEQVKQSALRVLESVSRETVAQNHPDQLETFDKIMAAIDINDPLTIVRLGDFIVKNKAAAALEILTALQVEPDTEALRAIAAFETDLSKRIAPIAQRYQKEEEKPKNIFEQLLEVVRDVVAIIRRQPTARKIEVNAAPVSEAETLAQIAQDTVKDAKELQRFIKTKEHLPEVIQKQINRAVEISEESALGFYVALAVANELNNKYEKQLPDLTVKAEGENASIDDQMRLRQVQDALVLLNTRRGDLTASFVAAYTSKTMARELTHINAKSALELGRLEGIVLPEVLGTLSNIGIQQRLAEVTEATVQGNEIYTRATQASAKGFQLVLEQSKKSDQAVLDSFKAVASAATKTISDIDAFRIHEAEQAGKQETVRAALRTSFADLSVALQRAQEPSKPEENPKKLAILKPTV